MQPISLPIRILFIVACLSLSAFTFVQNNQRKNDALTSIAGCTQRSATLVSIDGIREHTSKRRKTTHHISTVYGLVALPELRAQIALRSFTDDREAAERYRQQTPTNQPILVYKTLDPASPVISEQTYQQLHERARDSSHSAKLFPLLFFIFAVVAIFMPHRPT